MDWLTGRADRADRTGRADMAGMADRADMADKANSRVILPTIAYIDGKSEIISDSLTDSTNCKKMLSHLKKLHMPLQYMAFIILEC